MSDTPENAPVTSPKLDPETLVLRGSPRRVIRFRRGAIIAIAALGSTAIIGVTWVALKSSAFRVVASGDHQMSPAKAPPDALAVDHGSAGLAAQGRGSQGHRAASLDRSGEVNVADLKLPKLPDRTPVKLTITVMPDLHRALGDYAAIYNEIYGQDEPLVELVPHMLTAFLASDRGFAKSREARAKAGQRNG